MLAKVGKYEILEKVGVGGFGTVYKGRDPFIKRTVAIKTCQSDEDELRKRFFREAEYAGNLHHRNITTIYDFGLTEEGLPFIVQEFLTGEDLDRKIKRRDDLPLAFKVRVLADICDGLHYAHASGIVHRDVKPSNIRILEDGTVKIMDFGIAKSMVSESTLTQTGITLGTASYLAPEQIRGEPVDARTDIFSLGVLAFELLGYARPFTGDHISTVLYKIMNEPPPSLAELDPGLPLELVRIVGRSLEKDRSARFASCAEMAESLRRVLETISGPVAAPPRPSVDPSPASPRGIASQRLDERILSPVAGGGSAAADLPLQPSRPSPGDATSPSASGGAAETGGALRVFLGALAVLVVGGGGLAWLLLGPGGKTNDPTPGRTGVAAATPGPEATPVPAAAPTPVPTAAPTAAPTAVPTAAATGTAVVSANVFSKLSIDGKPRGTVFSKPTRIALPPGKHVAAFEIDKFGALRVPFEIVAGATVEVPGNFPPLGELRISVNPDAVGADVLVDGVVVGRAGPAPLVRTVAAGSRRVEARLAGFVTEAKVVEVPEESQATVLLTLRKP